MSLHYDPVTKKLTGTLEGMTPEEMDAFEARCKACPEGILGPPADWEHMMEIVEKFEREAPNEAMRRLWEELYGKD